MVSMQSKSTHDTANVVPPPSWREISVYFQSFDGRAIGVNNLRPTSEALSRHWLFRCGDLLDQFQAPTASARLFAAIQQAEHGLHVKCRRTVAA